ncbi:MAG: DUF2007 domain-containing protein [Chloroflexi bacterium]|nr:DUF2007 domain-containing protein [Chloroflexota bacterium]
MKWAQLTTAPDQLMAEMWRDLLLNEGIPAALRGGDVSSYFGITTYPCRILVDEERVTEARETLEGYLGHELDK